MTSCSRESTASTERKSHYAMISMDEAVEIVLQQSERMPVEEVSLFEACGRICSENVLATENFPPFPASIMDGYAVSSPLEPGIYKVSQRVHAGNSPDNLERGTIAYITTGVKYK